MMLNITNYINIKDNVVKITGKNEFSVEQNLPFKEFAKACYKNYEIGYSKFYKMDKLSKLGFLASEILLQGNKLSDYNSEDIALILANSSSSLNNDKRYQQSINEIPSPSIFVYTLPNIVIGEICIKNNIKGEAAFFLQEAFDTKFIKNYVEALLTSGAAKACITGWVEIDMEDNYNAILYLIENRETGITFNELNLEKIYKG
jgi:hypothetical protein